MWDNLRYEAERAWYIVKQAGRRIWYVLGNRRVSVLLQVLPAVLTVVTSYYSLAAARKANETGEQAFRSGEQSLEISKRSQQLAEDVAARERWVGRADLLATMEEETCWRAQEGLFCSATFTLTNAGRYAAESIAVAIEGKAFSGLDLAMKLPGDLPGGQHQQFTTQPYPYDKRISTYVNVILAVAYQDKELRLCPQKSWAFQVAAGATEPTVTRLRAAGTTADTSWTERNAVQKSPRSNCREPDRGSTADTASATAS